MDSKIQLPTSITEDTSIHIYDIISLEKRKGSHNHFIAAFPSKSLDKIVPRAPVKKLNVPVKSTNCYNCDKVFARTVLKHPCYGCGETFCYYCVFNVVAVKLGGIRGWQELCRSCIDQNKVADANHWFLKACELVESEVELQPAFRCFQIALHLKPGLDDRLTKFSCSARNNPHKGVVISLELLQLENLPKDIFFQLQAILADFLLECCLSPSICEIGALVASYHFCSMSLISYAEVRFYAGKKWSSDDSQKQTKAETIRAEILQYISIDECGFAPFYERIKHCIMCPSIPDILSEISQLPPGRRSPFLAATVLRMEIENFPNKLKDLQGEAYALLKGIDLIRNAGQFYETMEGFHLVEKLFWKNLQHHDELGNCIVNLHTQVLGEGRTAPYEAILMSAVTGEVDGHSLLTSSQLAPPANRLWPQLSLGSLSLKPMEEAIYNQQKVNCQKPLEAALSYWELLELCEYKIECVACILNSSLYALQHLQDAVGEKQKETEIYLVVRLILFCTGTAMSIAYQANLPPPMKYYVSRIAFCVARQAGLLSRFSQAADEAGKYLKSMIVYAPLCPVLMPPIVLASEILLLTLAYKTVFSPYLKSLENIHEDQLPLSYAHLKYFQYEDLIDNEGTTDELESARQTAMTEMMIDRGIDHDDVRELICSPLVNRDKAGWMIRKNYLAGPLKNGFLKVNGVAINKNTQQVRLLVKKPDFLAHSFIRRKFMINWDDVATLFCEDLSEVPFFFSLEQPNDMLSLHPFQEFRYQPPCIRGSQVLNTLFHTDYLIKQAAMGFEISAHRPYSHRLCSEEMLNDLPPSLAKAMRSTIERGERLSGQSRLWIQTDTIYYDCQTTKEEILYVLGDVDFSVRTHILMPNAGGELQDAICETDKNSPEEQFGKNMTLHFDELCSSFPEFARIGELAKIRAIMCILHRYRNNLERDANNCIPSVSECREAFEEFSQNRKKDCQQITATLGKACQELEESTGTLDTNDITNIVKVYISNIVKNQLLPRVPEGLVQTAFHRFFRYRDDSALVGLMLEQIPQPSQEEVKASQTAEIRRRLGLSLKKFDDGMNGFKTQCRHLKNYTHIAEADVNQGLAKPEWVPAICQIDWGLADGETCSILHGGVAAMADLEKKTLPTYTDGFTETLNSATFKAQKNLPYISETPKKETSKGRSQAGRNNLFYSFSRDGFEELSREIALLHKYLTREQKGLFQHKLNQRRKEGRKHFKIIPGYEFAHNPDTPARDGFDYSIENVTVMLSLDHLLLDKRLDFFERRGIYKNRPLLQGKELCKEWIKARTILVEGHRKRVAKAGARRSEQKRRNNEKYAEIYPRSQGSLQGRDGERKLHCFLQLLAAGSYTGKSLSEMLT